MQCPVDGTTLVMTDRSGVEIDYCPKCRGVWLDRGELDKIIERANNESPNYLTREPEQRHDYDENRSYERQGNDHDREHGRKKKRGSFMEDIFGGFGD